MLLTASQKYYVISIYRMIYLAVNSGIIIVLMKLRLDIGLVYLISFLANIMNTLMVYRYMGRNFKFLDLSVPEEKPPCRAGMTCWRIIYPR